MENLALLCKRFFNRRRQLLAHGVRGRRKPVNELAIAAEKIFMEIPFGAAQHSRLFPGPDVNRNGILALDLGFVSK